jgi:hypothetical protein
MIPTLGDVHLGKEKYSTVDTLPLIPTSVKKVTSTCPGSTIYSALEVSESDLQVAPSRGALGAKCGVTRVAVMGLAT